MYINIQELHIVNNMNGFILNAIKDQNVEIFASEVSLDKIYISFSTSLSYNNDTIEILFDECDRM